MSLSLVDAEQDHKFFTISYAWDNPVCKPVFESNGSVRCARAEHGTAPWTNNKALCNNYLSHHRSNSDGYMDILINGQKFYVQGTVYNFLQTLQASAEIQQRLQNGEYFWLDAICINQNNIAETKQQTSNMHEIYKAARHVYAWLGISYDRSSLAMDFMSHLTPSTSPQEPVPSSQWWTQSHSEDQYWSLYYLFNRPYWQRIWVVQEFLLARDTTLLCGNRAVPSCKAVLLVNQLDSDHEFRKRYPQWAATPAVKIIQARTVFHFSYMRPPLEDLINRFLFSRSTYPEDKLIGLLKLSFSTVQLNFHGESGSVEKRMDVIDKIVSTFEDEGMDHRTARDWKRLLACLLGVRSMLPESDRTTLTFEPIVPTRLAMRSSREPVRGNFATIALPTERLAESRVIVKRNARTKYDVDCIGNVRSVRTPRWLVAQRVADMDRVGNVPRSVLTPRMLAQRAADLAKSDNATRR